MFQLENSNDVYNCRPSDTVLANAENLQNSRGIPKEIWFLCDLLTTHSDFQVSTGYLFLMPGEHEEILASKGRVQKKKTENIMNLALKEGGVSDLNHYFKQL